jgi:L-alanine-DL-glutamate epimerase-like enolase superfamily enzyme
LTISVIWRHYRNRKWGSTINVERLETFIVNVPYKRTEVSSIVFRGGVTSVVVKLTTDTGLIGWGEACSGADVHSISAALQAMFPFIKGRSPWVSAEIRRDVFLRGLWALRATTGNYAWAAFDMALWDLCGKSAQLPLYKLLGGAIRKEVDYFYYLTHGNLDDISAQCAEGMKNGYQTYYLKTGINLEQEVEMVKTIRKVIGLKNRIRLDSNGSWSLQDAPRFLERFATYGIDFVEQPVREHPMSLMSQLRLKTSIPLAANEGLWTEEDANRLILNRVADVYTFSPYWVGSLEKFRQVSYVAQVMGSKVCRHTHGELGIAATAFHHASLTIPNLVEGNQQTAAHMEGDILQTEIPIAKGPTWGLPEGVGLGLEVDISALNAAKKRFENEGQYLPYGTV